MRRRANPLGTRAAVGLLGLLLAACSGSEPDPAGPSGPLPAWQLAVPTDDGQAPGAGWLLSVWGPTNGEVYAVGGTRERGAVLRRDGSDFRPVELGVEVPLLNWVFGFSERQVTAVGNRGTALHFDGERWLRKPTGTDQDLWGVWGAAPDDLWAVGGGGLREGDATLLHYDGNEWAEGELPSLQRARVFALYKVWGSAADDVYAVGQSGAALHYDGESWQELFVGASDDLISIWGTGPDDIVAVGGRAAGILSRFDGRQWTTQSLAPLPGLNGVWLRTPTTAHVVGGFGTLARVDLETLDITRSEPLTQLDVHGVFGTASGRIFCVGGNFVNTVPPYRNVLLTRELQDEE